MHKVIAELLFLCLCLTPFAYSAGQTGDVPYVYYYSPKLNTFVVERADASDRHQFRRSIYRESSLDMGGLGWSPNGEWFAASGVNEQSTAHC